MKHVCVAIFLLAVASAANAQLGRVHASFGGSNYYYSWRDGRPHAPWAVADQTCRSLGMSLVSLDSPAEANYIRGVVGQEAQPFLWTSGRQASSGWIWSATGQPFTFTQWSHTGGAGRPQPDNREGGEVCMALLNNVYRDGITWHDIACHHTKPFVCETRGGFLG